MTMSWKRATALAATTVFLAALGACQSSETIAPDGSTITVAANPATIPLGSGSECSLIRVANCGTANVVATVYSKMGIPLPDQDVRFSSTAGFLFTGSLTSPVAAANIPISTDHFGNANVGLITSTTSTVTARSGPATGTLSITTVQGNLSNILLNLDTTSTGCSGSTSTITNCTQKVCVVADANDAANAPVPGVVILFKIQNNVATNGSSSDTFNVTFTQSQTTTDTNGKAFTSFTPDSTCQAQCGGSKPCQGEIVATTQGGAFPSPPLVLNVSIP